MKRKIISLLLALIMAVSLLPMSVLAADPAGSGGKDDAPTGFSFSIVSGKQTVSLTTKKVGSKNTVYIPVSLMNKTAVLDFIIKSISKQFLDLTLCNSANGGKACIYGLFRHLLYGRTIRI